MTPESNQKHRRHLGENNKVKDRDLARNVCGKALTLEPDFELEQRSRGTSIALLTELEQSKSNDRN